MSRFRSVSEESSTVAACAVLPETRRDEDRAETALNTMSQGVSMFDAEKRLVYCNRPYREMFRLPDELAQPGTPFQAILESRAAAGLFAGDEPQAYVRDRLLVADGGQPATRFLHFNDGRIICVANRPLPEGGWVATHEDVTERQRVESETHHTRALVEARAEAETVAHDAEVLNARLREAVDVVPEGVALLDADDRFVLWNRGYADSFAARDAHLAVGMSFEAALRAGLDAGCYPSAVGREEAWLVARLARHATAHSVFEEQLCGDRWARIEERSIAGGGRVILQVDITELKRREASFRLLFECNPLPMWVYDRDDFRFLAVNDAAIGHYGYTRAEFLAMGVLDIRPRREREKARATIAAHHGIYYGDQTSIHCKADGTEMRILIYSQPLDYEGRTAALVAAVDVTERRRALEDLQRTKDILDAVVENVPVSIFLKDAVSLTYVFANRAAEEFNGLNRQDIIGRTAGDLLDSATATLIDLSDREVLRSRMPSVFAERMINTPRRGHKFAMTRSLPILSDKGDPRYILTLIADLSERQRAEAQIQYLARHDGLTGLPNRSAFLGHLEELLVLAETKERSFAILCMDIDRLKEINDLFGHSSGDLLVKEVASRLHSVVGEAFLARLDGDEFALIINRDMLPADIASLAEQFAAAVAAPFTIENNRVRISISIGIAMCPADGRDATSLLANVEAALCRAKLEGRGTIRFFEVFMDKRLRERRALHHDLRSALERDELVLFYQPQASASREIIGFEALLRWVHPMHGLVPPATFIPVAEESGLMPSIGAWVLERACREAASWSTPLKIAVNLSPMQFRQDDLAAIVQATLRESGLAASRLELEITEGVLIEDSIHATEILHRLKALGVEIAMDDFGTGYSSLSYLQSFPFDKIKIDRSFVANMETSTQSAAIIRAVIALGHSLHLPVAAEGVETEAQLAALVRESCDEMQGYFIGRPKPIEDYADYVLPPSVQQKRA